MIVSFTKEILGLVSLDSCIVIFTKVHLRDPCESKWPLLCTKIKHKAARIIKFYDRLKNILPDILD